MCEILCCNMSDFGKYIGIRLFRSILLPSKPEGSLFFQNIECKNTLVVFLIMDFFKNVLY